MDILGSQEMGSNAQAQEYLERLFDVLKLAREYVPLGSEQSYKVATFTDNLVLGWPIKMTEKDAEAEYGFTFFHATGYQYELAREGFFVRGGITRGLLYMDADFVFGPGLIDAYNIERSVAIQPRIVLSKPLIKLCWEHSHQYYGKARHTPHNRSILVSEDGEAFLNYLSVLDDEEADVHAELIRHKVAIEWALEEYSTRPEIRKKYRWLAGYHNYFCSSNYREMTGLQIKRVAPAIGFYTLADIEAKSNG
ncbi:MAG: hypothetical protein IIC87_05570 [Chloroflexi bacterium]|nr:hypothetical protein [Chloroflexota bacterium]